MTDSESSKVRRDCCDFCAEADRIGGCQYVHPDGSKGMIARCCPPGTKSSTGCESCIPCDGFHLKGSAYFATGVERLVAQESKWRPRREGRKRRRGSEL